MKRTLRSIMAAALLFALILRGSVGCTSGDDDIFADVEPAPASDFEYEAADDGDGIRLIRYIGSDETVVIPSEIDGKPVTELGRVLDEEESIPEEGVFTRSPVKAVAIPDSVTKIGPHTFSNCRLLKQVSFPKNLELIEYGAFEDCVSLESVDLTGTKLLQIFEESFRRCENLREVKFPDTLNVIWSWAFEGCASLTEGDLPDNVATVGEDAFSNCTSLKVVKLPRA